MYDLVSKLVIFNNKDTILYELSDIIHEFHTAKIDKKTTTLKINEQVNKILKIADYYSFTGNLWHDYLLYLLTSSENIFTLMVERRNNQDISDFSISKLVTRDLKIFIELMNYDFSRLEDELLINSFTIISNYTPLSYKPKNQHASIILNDFIRSIPTNLDETILFSYLCCFYQKFGVGKFAFNKAFKLSSTNNHDDELIIPITSFNDSIMLDDLVGYEVQKQALIRNTEAFINSNKANNVLLYGDAGTGKSSSIKAILNRYYNHGLRIIEVYKHETKYLSELISEIKDRNYFFIIYMDDLSFEESESEYKYLKALIEGGLEVLPDNILIYATSNRRHLIKETWNERTDMSSSEDMYHSDTVREKLSLVDRFGISIGYYKPTFNEYVDIVISLARKFNSIKLSDDELKSEAKKWIVNHGSPSGRTAEQLIYYLLGEN